jgi:hypothetical protein
MHAQKRKNDVSSRRALKDLRRAVNQKTSHVEPPSRHMPPPTILARRKMPEGIYADAWSNGFYEGHLRRYESGAPIGGGPYAIISLTACDQTARHDWREFQQLKTYLVGPEWEGLEMYPAESRLQDPSNCFYLFCFPLGVIPWGGHDRIVSQPRDAIAPQRPFPPLADRMPP